jgi:hypothetical protein
MKIARREAATRMDNFDWVLIALKNDGGGQIHFNFGNDTSK